MIIKPTSPCHGCEMRDATCHAVCEVYKDYERAKIQYYEAKDAARQEIDKYKAIKAKRKQR